MADPPGGPQRSSLVEAAARGDVDALAQIMARHHGDMTRICMVITGDPDVAAEAVQAAWIVAWRRLGTLRDPERLRPWLMSIAANEARQLLRSSARRASRELAAPPAPFGSDPAARPEVLDLAAAISRLEPDERRLIALRFSGGLTSDEIARELGGSPSAIRGRIARVIGRLRMDLTDV